ncbi:MAG: sensor histidine kinase [Bacteroidetes bacterium]|nr:MAG: sensor histidine kinase [Bacteroidota bacterium]
MYPDAHMAAKWRGVVHVCLTGLLLGSGILSAEPFSTWGMLRMHYGLTDKGIRVCSAPEHQITAREASLSASLENTGSDSIRIFADPIWYPRLLLTVTGADGQSVQYRGGYSEPQPAGQPLEERFSFSFVIPPGSFCEIRFEILNHTGANPPPFLLTLFDKRSIYEEVYYTFFSRRDEYRVYAASMGIMLFQVLFTLIFGVLGRKGYYLYYGLYILIFCVILQLNYGEYFFHPIPGWMSIFRLELLRILYFAAYYFYFRFIRDFLSIRERAPHTARRIAWIEWMILAYLLIQLVLMFFTSLQRILYIGFSLLLFIWVVLLLRDMLRVRSLLVNLVLIGSGVFTLCAFANLLNSMLVTLAGVSLWDTGYNVTVLGALLEMFFFSTAIAYKLRLEEVEKRMAQEQLIEGLKQNQILAQKLQDIRNRIARDLHDDIGATLSSISIYSEVALRQINQPGASADAIGKIARQAAEMMAHMSDTVWAIHPRNDNMPALVRRMEDVAASLLGASGIAYQMEISPDIEQITLNIDHRNQLFFIFKEAVNNIVKHSRASSARISLQLIQGSLRMEISDNGQGFDPQGAYPGNGLHNLYSRAAEIGGTLELESGAGGTKYMLLVLCS